MNAIPTDQALAPPAQTPENTNNPLLAVASSEIVLPDCSQDVGSEGLERLKELFRSSKVGIKEVKDTTTSVEFVVSQESWDKACLIITNAKDSEDIMIMSSIDGIKHLISKECLKRVFSN